MIRREFRQARRVRTEALELVLGLLWACGPGGVVVGAIELADWKVDDLVEQREGRRSSLLLQGTIASRLGGTGRRRRGGEGLQRTEVGQTSLHIP